MQLLSEIQMAKDKHDGTSGSDTVFIDLSLIDIIISIE
jgi:hypothetical protein